MSATLNQHELGTLPSNTVQNPKNDNYSIFVTTWSGKDTTDPYMSTVDNKRNDLVITNDMDVNEIENLVISNEA